MNNRARQFNVCGTIVCEWCASGFHSYHTWRQHGIYSCFFFSRRNNLYTGADPGFFLGGGALVSCSTSTPTNHIVFFFCRIPLLVLENRRSSRGGGAHPLHPPPRSAPAILEVLLLVHMKNLLLSCIYTTKVFLTNGLNWSHFNINYWAQLFEGWLALNLASHAGVFRGARFSSLKTPAWEATLNPGFSFLCSKEFSRIIS